MKDCPVCQDKDPICAICYQDYMAGIPYETMEEFWHVMKKCMANVRNNPIQGKT